MKPCLNNNIINNNTVTTEVLQRDLVRVCVCMCAHLSVYSSMCRWVGMYVFMHVECRWKELTSGIFCPSALYFSELGSLIKLEGHSLGQAMRPVSSNNSPVSTSLSLCLKMHAVLPSAMWAMGIQTWVFMLA